MKLGYPNLELLDYKAREIIQELIYISPNKHYYFELEAIMFPQTWASTALGFGGVGGQALTTAYTTIIYHIETQVYIVFFDKEVAYTIQYPNEQFFNDMQNRKLVDVQQYKSRYTS